MSYVISYANSENSLECPADNEDKYDRVLSEFTDHQKSPGGEV